MNNHVHVVIMAGGTGTRFWPHSRNNKPKQFLDVLGTKRSLLQMTYDRFAGLVPDENFWVVSNEIYKTLLQEQLPALSRDQFLLEPAKKNTAPCVAYASYKIRQKDPEGILLILPSDHVIFDTRKFIGVLEGAIEGAAKDKLITIGIQPNRPETGYGYIQYESDDESTVKRVKTFTEKPEVEIAKKFFESGDFVWNAGIFVCSISAIIKAFEIHQPELAEIFEEGHSVYFSAGEDDFIRKAYGQCKSISIDYAIMEKADNVFVVLGEFGWSDLGSWNALHEIKTKDDKQNVLEGDVMTYDCSNNYVISQNNRLLVLHDLNDYLIADFEDVLLICKKSDSAIFREFVEDVRISKGDKLI